jgi:hypothetical protein
MDNYSIGNAKVNIDDTSVFPRSEDLSVADWVSSMGLAPFAQDAMSSVCSALCGREPDEVSVHYLMDYIKSGGGWTALSSDDEHGSQSLWIREGMSVILQWPVGRLIECSRDLCHRTWPCIRAESWFRARQQSRRLHQPAG